MLIYATGKSLEGVTALVASARHFFLRRHHVTFYLFSDQSPDIPNVVVIQKVSIIIMIIVITLLLLFYIHNY